MTTATIYDNDYQQDLHSSEGLLSPSLGPSTPYDQRNNEDGIYPYLKEVFTESPYQHSYLGSSTQALGHSHILQKCLPKTTGGWPSIQVVHNDRSRLIYETMLVGEMRSKTAGTKLGSTGNHYIGADPSTATLGDGATPRNQLMVGPPSKANKAMTAIWVNQMAELNALAAAISVDNQGSNEVSSIVHNAPNDEQHIKILTEQIYKKADRKKVATKPATKVDLATINSPEIGPAPAPDTQSSDPAQTDDVKIELGAVYPLNRMPDHVGPFFTQKTSRVKQHDITDIDGNLVPPWLLYIALRAGVLALFEGIFNIWCPPNKAVCLQFEAKRIKVIATSNSTPERPMPPCMPKDDQNESSICHNSLKRSDAFTAFNDRAKRIRTDLLGNDAPGGSSSSNKDTHMDLDAAELSPPAHDSIHINPDDSRATSPPMSPSVSAHTSVHPSSAPHDNLKKIPAPRTRAKTNNNSQPAS